ncbi:NrtA/SsuA/CpmA family ABC transporter substrate-binding protein [uncultured Parasutterella sp.]|uniref:ABC transporter substrate-binding protein n=1 Tax=uncultured Parasutterella sp. TaxID=1263098 RepID=UPI00259AC9D2|nr:NrtA/SsuA/CpmA family ABC transporter substrate-binding protein [uncultured Parasutterella sp.]
MKMKSLIASILFLAASAVSAAAPQIKELNISYVKPPFVLQLLVMKDRQMLEKEFEKEGIKVNWHNMGTSPEAARAMGAGSLDIAGNMNTAAVLMLNSEGLPVRILTGTAHPASNFAIVSKPGTHLTIKDLKGKQVVGPKGTFLHQLLVAALEKEGLKESDVQFVNMGIPKALSAIMAGRADAALVASSALIKANKSGAETIVNADGLVEPTLVMTTTQKFAEEHPDIVKRVSKVYKEALLWMKNNPDQTAEMGAKEHGISVENAKTLIERSHYFDKMTQKDVNDLRINKKFLKDNGMMRNPVKVEELVLPLAFE